MPKFVPGVEYDFGGGKVYVIAPLSIGVLVRMQAKLEALSSTSSLAADAIATILKATHASLLRNYPDISEEQVGDLVDVGNMHEVINLVLDVGGFKRKAAEDAAKKPSAQTAVAPPPPAGQPS